MTVLCREKCLAISAYFSRRSTLAISAYFVVGAAVAFYILSVLFVNNFVIIFVVTVFLSAFNEDPDTWEDFYCYLASSSPMERGDKRSQGCAVIMPGLSSFVVKSFNMSMSKNHTSSLKDLQNVLQSWDNTLVNLCTLFHVTCDSNNLVITDCKYLVVNLCCLQWVMVSETSLMLMADYLY
ncbi:Somatic embryogenesis receptor kinase 1 [Carex littledalei]|uniref:Somatic embryogenesis receptor kinase 1 n=1 Tax=Carex littledalei TaxID=544730 RepID=A0A833RRP7_9POAL|nr:Somatic embryogenesis receptor kinase 1 [Carex littledalei]